jgi:hypothetical protein
MITTPRCRQPVQNYELAARRARPAIEEFVPCWRPAGHKGGHHLSREHYERWLRRKSDRYWARKLARQQVAA